MTIKAEIQKLSVDELVEFFVLDATPFGGTLYRWHSGKNLLLANVVWQGNTYTAQPIEVTGYEYTGQGKLPRPAMSMNNVDGLMGAVVDTFDDLIGAVVTRKRTFAKYLDAVNFPGGTNPDADPTAAFPDDIYAILRKVSHTKFMIEFELASLIDLHGIMLPRRQIIQHTCLWVYRSAECSYAGGAVADANDVPTLDSNADTCGKRVVSCQMRFGNNGILPFAGFPGSGVLG